MPRKFLLAILTVALVTIPPLWAQRTPDFAQARAEAVRTLQGLIRIDTSNPPGNETKAAEYLKEILDKEGIPSEFLALEPPRGNLVARIKGNGRKKPLLLMGHTDVVGVEREKWTVEPFVGVLRDGYVYGRGASDDKGGLVGMLQVLLLIHRQKLPLDRDIILVAEAGEEGTTAVGIDFLVEKHWPKIEAEFALNEGGWIQQSEGKVQYVAVQTTEKVPRRIRLVARGVSGHGSIPRPDNPIVRLAAAIATIGAYQPPMRLNETTRVFFQRLAKISPPEEAFLFAHLEDPVEGPKVQETLRHSKSRSLLTYNSMLRTSLSPTLIHGGFRNNVIPAEAEATVDLRAVPDEEMESFLAELRRLINDPAVEIIPPEGYRPVNRPAPLDSEMFRALEASQAAVFPDAVTLPVMGTGATDSAQIRAQGIQAYGVHAPASDDDRARVHGNDERMSVEGLGKYIEFVYRAVVSVAAAR